MSDLLASSDEPIARHELAGAFRARERGGQERLIGLELEACAVTGALEPAPFARIESLLERLLARGWSPQREDGRTVGLARATGERVSLEPGGQLELVSAPARSLAQLVTASRGHLAELAGAAREEGLHLLGGGLQPFATLNAIPWMPKRRHELLRRHFARAQGTFGPVMMKKTQSVQVSLDWIDEADGAARLRAGLLAAPVLGALFGASPLEEARPAGAVSRRLAIWAGVDRAGFVEPALREGAGYDAYVAWALELPAILRVVRGRYEAADPLPFRELIRRGRWSDGGPLLRADWEAHLTTVFTHARWKNVIELRVADAPLPGETFAPVALMVGLFDDPRACAAALERLAVLRRDDLERGMADAARLGLRGKLGGWRLQEWARELVALARAGLEARVAAGREPRWVLDLLAPAERDARAGTTPAERLLANARDPSALLGALELGERGAAQAAA